MRFFSGNRDKKSGKITASGLFKKKLGAKPGEDIEPTPEEKYKKMLESKIEKMTQDAMMGKKNHQFKLAGTKEADKPKELSDNAKQMIRLLAMKKAQKEQKIAVKKEREWQRQQKSIKKRLTAEQKAADDLIEQQKKEAEAAYQLAQQQQQQAASQTSYFFGHNSDDKKDGW